MSTARAMSPRGLPVIITAVAGLVVTLVLVLLTSPCCADDGTALASVTTADGSQPGSVASDRCTGRAPVVDAAVRLGAWAPVGVAVIAALLAGTVAPRRLGRRRGSRVAARYALCVMRT